MHRFAAIVLTDLACEIAQRDHGAVGPFAVIVDVDESSSEDVIEKNAILDAIDRKAWRFGARPGQTASQASAYVAGLQIFRISQARILETLGAVAEIALAFGVTSALALKIERGQLPLRDEAEAASLRYPLGAGAGPHDTVWLDVSGCSKLVGGDDVLADELCERVAELGHRVRVSIADGPRIAQASLDGAMHKTSSPNRDEGDASLLPLPVASLPLESNLITWLGKLGILRIDDLTRLDRSRLSHRLGVRARDLLEVIAGRDDVPLVAYHPPRKIVESSSFEHEIESTSR